MVNTNTLLFAFGLTILAGLSTVIGSVLVLYVKKVDKRFLSVVLGFSAGVMIYVSLVEIFAEAKLSLTEVYGATKGYWFTTIAFFTGIAIIAIIDKFVPSSDNPHEILDPSVEKYEQVSDSPDLMRIGLFSALAIAIHNFPEGIATFVSAIENPALGLSIAIAIAIHNIPEGIAISVPIFYATKKRKKAILYSFLSGLSEPVGAVVGYLLLSRFFNDAMFGLIFAAVAGIMVYISLDELLPTAEKYGEHHLAIYGLILGMILMALSLLLLA